MYKQTYGPIDAGNHNTSLISRLGLESPEGIISRQGRDWVRHQVCRHDTFSLVVAESHCASADDIGYTRQEDYIKVNFWLSGRHTTVLDGFGQHEHDQPEVFITSGPLEMIKVDVLKRETQIAVVALCLLRDFFPVHMGIGPEELPEPLRGIVAPVSRPYSFCRFPLTPDLSCAARAILAAPFALRRNAVYGKAKCVELMCLLINLMAIHDSKSGLGLGLRSRHENRLCKAREVLTQRYAEAITLEEIAREVGLNRLSLSTGFRRMFSMSVYDYLQKERMERAYELLRDNKCTVTKVAEAVGFNHSCNFSTAFRRYFGCSPQKIRGNYS
jgi:AraC-like DNA-binding protein